METTQTNPCMRNIRKGQIYYVNSCTDTPPVGSETWPDRYAVIVSEDATNRSSDCVSIIWLTKGNRKRVSPTHIKVQVREQPAIALCERVYSVDKSRLENSYGELPDSDIKSIMAGISLGLGITGSEDLLGLFHKWENYVNKYRIFTGKNAEDTSVAPDGSLLNMIDSLVKERDSYKALYNAQTQKLMQISLLTK